MADGGRGLESRGASEDRHHCHHHYLHHHRSQRPHSRHSLFHPIAIAIAIAIAFPCALLIILGAGPVEGFDYKGKGKSCHTANSLSSQRSLIDIVAAIDNDGIKDIDSKGNSNSNSDNMSSIKKTYEQDGDEAREIAKYLPYYPFKGIPRFYDIGGFLAEPEIFQKIVDIFVARYSGGGITRSIPSPASTPAASCSALPSRWPSRCRSS